MHTLGRDSKFRTFSLCLFAAMFASAPAAQVFAQEAVNGANDGPAQTETAPESPANRSVLPSTLEQIKFSDYAATEDFKTMNQITADDLKNLGLSSTHFYLEDLTAGTDHFDAGPLLEQNADEKTSIASLTKIMTALVFLSDLNSGSIIFDGSPVTWDSAVNIPDGINTYDQAYTAHGFTAGQSAAVKDLLYTLLLSSSADSANALAIIDAGSIPAFVGKMNQKAADLGLKATHFSNPVGMDAEETTAVLPDITDSSNYSTVREVAAILKAALKTDHFNDIYTASTYTLSDGTGIKKTLNQTAEQSSLDLGPIVGAKTGYSEAAGRCLSSLAAIDDRDFLLVTTGAPADSLGHITDAAALYGFISAHYATKVITSDEDIVDLPVHWGKSGYKVTSAFIYGLFLKDTLDPDSIKFEFVPDDSIKDQDGQPELNKDTAPGALLGYVNAVLDGKTIARTRITLDQDLEFINYPLILGVVVILFAASATATIILSKKRKQQFERRFGTGFTDAIRHKK